MRGIRPYHPTFDPMCYLEVHYNLRPIPIYDISNLPDMTTLLGLNKRSEGAPFNFVLCYPECLPQIPLASLEVEHQVAQRDVSGKSSGA